MRKIILLILVVMMVGLITTDAFSWINTTNPDQRAKNYTTTAPITEVTTITTNNRLLGYIYSDSAAGQVVIYDTATFSSSASSNIIVVDGIVANQAVSREFPHPIAVESGIVTQHNASGRLTIFYE